MAYKIEKQTDSFYQIRHPDGSSFIVPKKGMSKDIHEKIKGLPGYAGGGDIEYPMDPRIPTPDRFNPNAGREAMQAVMSPIAVTSEDVNRANPEAITASPIQPADVLGPIAQGAIRAAPAIGRGAAELGKAIGERALANEVGSVGPDIGEIIAANQKNHLKNVKSLKASLEEYFQKELPQLKTDSSDSQYLTLNLNSKGQLVEPWEKSELRPIKIRISDHNRTSPRYEGSNPDINIAPGADTVETALNKLLGNKFEYNPNSSTMDELYPNKSFSGFNESQEKINSLLKILGAKEAKKYAHGGIVGEDNSMGYRIIKDSADHYQVLHPDGTKFTVPKKGISKQMHEKIAGMPKLFGGDDSESGFNAPSSYNVDFENQKQAEAIDAAQKQAQIDSMNKYYPRPAEGSKAGSVPSISQVMDQVSGKESAPEEKPSGEIPAPAKPEEVKKEVQAQAPADEQQAANQPGMKASAPEELPGMPKINPYAGAQMMAKAAKDYENQMIAHQNTLQDNAQKYEQAKAQDHAEMQDFINSHQIQQGHYWGSMDTGGKVMSSIAMILGGIGAGLAGGENQALKVINKAIEDDLDAQKENRNSGINALVQKGKDRDAVYSNYRANIIQKIQDQNNLYTAQAKTAEAKQNGAVLDQKLQEMKMTALQQADTRQAMTYLYQKGIPTKMIPPALLMDDKTRQQLVDVGGTSYMYKGRPEGAEIHNKMEANFRPIKDAIIELKHIGSAGLNKFTAEGQRARAIADMLPNAVAGFYSSAIDSKRISDTEGHRAESALSDPTSFLQAAIGSDVKGMAVLNEMQNIIESARSQMLSGYQATPKPAETAGASGAQKLPLNKVK